MYLKFFHPLPSRLGRRNLLFWPFGNWGLKFVWDLGFVVWDLRFIINAHHQRNVKGAEISHTEESVSSPHF
jgi:hypothetical protein